MRMNSMFRDAGADMVTSSRSKTKGAPAGRTPDITDGARGCGPDNGASSSVRACGERKGSTRGYGTTPRGRFFPPRKGVTTRPWLHAKGRSIRPRYGAGMQRGEVRLLDLRPVSNATGTPSPGSRHLRTMWRTLSLLDVGSCARDGRHQRDESALGVADGAHDRCVVCPMAPFTPTTG